MEKKFMHYFKRLSLIPPQKKYGMVAALAFVIVAGTAAVGPPATNYKNLKVLPKDISTKKLSGIMIDEFEDGLGVSCGFCHAKEKDSERLDYASDAKPEKQIARLMMKMTVEINKKYFMQKHPQIGDATLIVSCVTCHNGQPQPGDQ